MSFIKIVPVSQINSPTLDGRPDENKWFNCVPDSLAVGTAAVTGNYKPADWWKDQAYGENYAGDGTAARDYVGVAASLGAKLFALDNTSNTQLVADVHAQLALKHPCIATEPDPYAPQHPNWSHVILFYEDAPGSLTAMDPWAANNVTRSDATWAPLFEFREIWVLERIDMVPTGWSDNTTTHTLTAPNGIIMVQGFRDYILGHAWSASCVPLAREHGVSPEQGGGTRQEFTDINLRWTPAAGVHEESQGPLLLSALAQIGVLEAQIASAPPPKIDPAKLAKIASLARQVEADATQLEAAVTQLA